MKLLLTLFSILTISCSPQKETQLQLADLSKVDGNAALELVQKQLDFGPRTLNSPAAEKCANYIATFARNLGYSVVLDTWSEGRGAKTKIFRNIICTRPGKGNEFVLCGSHYDTKTIKEFPAFTGANDGASSTALLMHLMQQIAKSDKWQNSSEMRFVFFDGEEALVEYSQEDGLNGSRRYAHQLYQKNEHRKCRAMLLMDMVGDKDFKLTIPSNSDDKLIEQSRNISQELKLGSFFSVLQSDGFYDDHVPFRGLRIPTIDFIDFRYGPKHDERSGGAFWHSGEDTIDKLSAESLSRCGDIFKHLLFNISQ
ncbi:MAG: M28 family peptidase [Lentisphaeraceae bacterium]|nr:M28 family peptidase [Lentisphaeraceae bacterium]